MQGKSTGTGLYKCYQCRKPFPAFSMGTLFESSHVPLHIWLQAMYLIAGSKKGIFTATSFTALWASLSRPLGSCRTVSARQCAKVTLAPFGQGGGAVEVDETYIGRKAGAVQPKGGWGHKMTVLGLIDRNTGRSRLFHVDKGGTANSFDRSRQPVPRSTAHDRRGHHV